MKEFKASGMVNYTVPAGYHMVGMDNPGRAIGPKMVDTPDSVRINQRNTISTALHMSDMSLSEDQRQKLESL